MSQYGYAYRTISTYNINTTSSVRNEATDGAVTKPSAPYIPKFINGYSEGQVSKKKIIPVTSRPYVDDSEDEWKHQRQTSPDVDDFLKKAHKEARRSPPRSTFVTSSPDWGHSTQPKPYNGYADFGSNNKPIGGAIKHDGYNNAPNYGNKPLFGGTMQSYDNPDGYATRKPIETTIKPTAGVINHDGYTSHLGKDNYDYGYDDYSNKEGTRPRPKPTGSTIYNNGYGSDYGDYNKNEGTKSKSKASGSPIYNNRYGGDYGDYNNKEETKPNSKSSGSPIYSNRFGDDYGDYNNKEGNKPKSKPSGSPIYSNGYGDDYGDYNNKEGSMLKPTYSNGYGGGYGNYNNKEGSKPKATDSPVYTNGYGHGYDDDNDYGNHQNNKEGYKHGAGGPKPTPDVTGTLRKGTPLSKPTNDIGQAMEMLIQEAAMRKGGYDGPGKLARPRSPYDKARDEVNESESLNNVVTSAPQYRPSPSPSVPIKEETRPNGNFTLVPTRQRFNFNHGRRPDYDNKRDYGVINHKQAEKKFNGLTMDDKEAEKKFNINGINIS
ncbi:hypothetical protein VNO78_20353 [Psophocarpus tetragonolobus]|uniref:Uncharacterized protein n=1 Tax=Psophocarpus tetragonolobus TaxID=3891 RepID=A0AAN9XH16_PSOTE